MYTERLDFDKSKDAYEAYVKGCKGAASNVKCELLINKAKT
jgi:hypothetical protein